MEIEFKLPWELGNCGGDEFLCCEESEQKQGVYLPSSTPCAAEQGEDPFSFRSDCAFAKAYPSFQRRNCALFDVLLTAIESVVGERPKTKQELWRRVKEAFDNIIDSKPRPLYTDPEDGVRKPWMYAKVSPEALTRQFVGLHSLVLICQKRHLSEEKEGDALDSGSEEHEPLLTSRTAFELRVLRACDSIQQKPAKPDKSRKVGDLNEAQKTELSSKFLNSGSSFAASSSGSGGVVSGIASLRGAALGKKRPKETPSNLQVQGGPKKTKEQAESDEALKFLQAATAQTDRMLQVWESRQPAPVAPPPESQPDLQKLQEMKTFLDSGGAYLTDAQVEKATKKMQDIATEGFNKMFN